jgi:hypothetical protein
LTHPLIHGLNASNVYYQVGIYYRANDREKGIEVNYGKNKDSPPK